MILAATTVCGAGLARPEPASPWPAARRVDASRHRIWTDLPPERDALLVADADLLVRAFEAICAVPLRRAPPEGTFEVQIYADRDAYVRHARTLHPGAEGAPGYYDASDDTAHFLWREEDPAVRMTTVREVFFHEGAHQMWARWARPRTAPGRRPHFWASEGIACLFETLASTTLEETDGVPTLSIRRSLRWERCQDLVVEGRLVPLSDLVRMRQDDLNGERSADLYAQSCALAAFFLESERPGAGAFLQYVLEVESSRADGRTFRRLLGDGPEAFDAPFREWLDRHGDGVEDPDAPEDEPSGPDEPE